jgi:polysaccharide pyruvyl transferase WcaK-like protein
MKSRTRIALVNVRYSPNLGDGLIAECLEWALRQHLPAADIVSIDLAGRTAYSAQSGAHRGRALAILSILPRSIRRLVFSSALRVLIHLKYRPVWEAQLANSDVAILGGGQLLADADLNFPLKIRSISLLCRRLGLTGAVFGAGVSRDWSHRGKATFLEALQALSPKYVALRDADSIANWCRHIRPAKLPDAHLCRDPGLLAAKLYSSPRDRLRERPLVGLGVVHPHTLNMHANVPALSLHKAQHAWVEIIRALDSQGLDVALFTNGPLDDEGFLTEILCAAHDAGASGVVRLSRPSQPSALAANIAHCDAIIAHRLHANIVAYAFAIPHVGLGWDAKLPAFFASVDRRGFALGDIQSVRPEQVAESIKAAMSQPISRDASEAVASEALQDVSRLVQTLIAQRAV